MKIKAKGSNSKDWLIRLLEAIKESAKHYALCDNCDALCHPNELWHGICGDCQIRLGEDWN